MKAPRAIVCVGNRLVPGDALGPAVHDRLVADGPPPGIAVLDGGLKGLDLWPEVDGRARVVFVDTLDAADGVTVLTPETVAADAGSHGHAAGLPYLLAMLPHVATAPPTVRIVGATAPASEATVRAVAGRCVEVVRHDAA